jgi:hypothetical protein
MKKKYAECIHAFQLQQSLRERTKVLRYTYVVCIVILTDTKRRVIAERS